MTDTNIGAQATRACPTCGLSLPDLINECPQDGTRMPLAFENDPTFKHKYEFIEAIGMGGMGVIYKARQTTINKIVAIKMLHADMPSREDIMRFQLEGQASNLVRHKYIVQVFDLGVTESGKPYMIMEYLEGKTLAQELEKNGTLTTERFVKLFLQVCDALSYAHSKGVLHRDLKPSNIMLVQDGGIEQVRIMDFGIAKLLHGTESGAAQLTRTGEALGSPSYMSPEQSRTGKIDQRADLYSLGCVMYEALTGAPPFLGGTIIETLMMHIEQQPPSMANASLGREIEPGLQDIVMRLLRKSPDDRYQSAHELETDLLKFQDATYGGRQARFIYNEPNPAAATAKPLLGKKPIVIVSVLLLAVIGTAAAMIMAPPQKEASIAVQLDDGPPTKGWEDPKYKEWIAAEVNSQRQDLELNNFIGQIAAANNTDLEPLRNAHNARTIIFPKSTNVDDGALQYIKGLRPQALYLSDTGVTKLAPLGHMDSLLALDLSKTNVDRDGLRIVGGLHNLEHLYLAYTPIEDNDLQLLKNLHSLKSLDLSHCSHITDFGIQSLKASLPITTQIKRDDDQLFPASVDGKSVAEAEQLFTQQKYAQAEDKFGQVLSDLGDQPIRDKKALAYFLKRRAECCSRLKEYKKADQYFTNARGLITQQEAPSLLGDILDLHAEELEAQYQDTHDSKSLSKAAELREQLVAINDQLHVDSLPQLDQMRKLACDYAWLSERDKDKAITLLQKEIGLLKTKALTKTIEAAWATQTLAEIFIGRGRWGEANNLFAQTESSFRACGKVKDQSVYQRIETSMAKCDFELKHPEKAESILTKLLAQTCHDQALRQSQIMMMDMALRAQNKTDELEKLELQHPGLTRLPRNNQ